MKRFSILLLAMAAVFGLATAAGATTFTYLDVVDWNDIPNGDRSFKLIDDKNWFNCCGLDSHPFSYEHHVTFDPEAEQITSASLTLSHWGNYSSWFNAEVWLFSDNDGYFLDKLDTSGWCYGWVDQEFILPTEMYASIAGGSWSIGFKLTEATGGCLDYDVLKLDKSVLSGEYIAVAVMEPAAGLFLFFSLLGMCGAVRKAGSRAL